MVKLRSLLVGAVLLVTGMATSSGSVNAETLYPGFYDTGGYGGYLTASLPQFSDIMVDAGYLDYVTISLEDVNFNGPTYWLEFEIQNFGGYISTYYSGDLSIFVPASFLYIQIGGYNEYCYYSDCPGGDGVSDIEFTPYGPPAPSPTPVPPSLPLFLAGLSVIGVLTTRRRGWRINSMKSRHLTAAAIFALSTCAGNADTFKVFDVSGTWDNLIPQSGVFPATVTVNLTTQRFAAADFNNVGFNEDFNTIFFKRHSGLASINSAS